VTSFATPGSVSPFIDIAIGDEELQEQWYSKET